MITIKYNRTTIQFEQSILSDSTAALLLYNANTIENISTSFEVSGVLKAFFKQDNFITNRG